MKALKTGLKIIVGGTVLVGTFAFGALYSANIIGISIADKYPAIGWFAWKKAKDDVAAINEDTPKLKASEARVIKYVFDGKFD